MIILLVQIHGGRYGGVGTKSKSMMASVDRGADVRSMTGSVDGGWMPS